MCVPVERGELAEWAMRVEAAGELYLWLSAALDLPDPALLAPAFADLGLSCARTLSPGAPGAAWPEAAAFRAACAGTQPAEARLEAVQREHARLFIGPPQALIRPYESCFRESGRLMGESALAVRDFYAAQGIAFDGSVCRDAPDHVAVELMALAMICAGRTGHAVADRERLEREFLAAHLGQWGHDFAACLIEATREPLYRAAAELLGFVLTIRDQSRSSEFLISSENGLALF